MKISVRGVRYVLYRIYGDEPCVRSSMLSFLLSFIHLSIPWVKEGECRYVGGKDNPGEKGGWMNGWRVGRENVCMRKARRVGRKRLHAGIHGSPQKKNGKKWQNQKFQRAKYHNLALRPRSGALAPVFCTTVPVLSPSPKKMTSTVRSSLPQRVSYLYGPEF